MHFPYFGGHLLKIDIKFGRRDPNLPSHFLLGSVLKYINEVLFFDKSPKWSNLHSWKCVSKFYKYPAFSSYKSNCSECSYSLCMPRKILYSFKKMIPQSVNKNLNLKMTKGKLKNLTWYFVMFDIVEKVMTLFKNYLSKFLWKLQFLKTPNIINSWFGIFTFSKNFKSKCIKIPNILRNYSDKYLVNTVLSKANFIWITTLRNEKK